MKNMTPQQTFENILAHTTAAVTAEQRRDTKKSAEQLDKESRRLSTSLYATRDKDPLLAVALFQYQMMVIKSLNQSSQTPYPAPVYVGLSETPHSGIVAGVHRIPLLKVPVNYYKQVSHPHQRHTEASLVTRDWMEIVRDLDGNFHLCEQIIGPVPLVALDWSSVEHLWQRRVFSSARALTEFLAQLIVREETKSWLYFPSPTSS
jgi:hypothetical protein